MHWGKVFTAWFVLVHVRIFQRLKNTLAYLKIDFIEIGEIFFAISNRRREYRIKCVSYNDAARYKTEAEVSKSIEINNRIKVGGRGKARRMGEFFCEIIKPKRNTVGIL